MPILLILFIHKKHQKFSDEKFGIKYGTIYEEFKNDKGPISSYFYVVFVLRRLVLAVCFVFLQKHVGVQLFLAAVSNWAVRNILGVFMDS